MQCIVQQIADPALPLYQQSLDGIVPCSSERIDPYCRAKYQVLDGSWRYSGRANRQYYLPLAAQPVASHCSWCRLSDALKCHARPVSEPLQLYILSACAQHSLVVNKSIHSVLLVFVFIHACRRRFAQETIFYCPTVSQSRQSILSQDIF